MWSTKSGISDIFPAMMVDLRGEKKIAASVHITAEN
jgi:hypothetical protein